jgi:nicotinamidase-related amidase
VYSLSYNQEGSIWYTQIGWCENPKDTDIAKELQNSLPEKNVYKVHKLTRSIFKADEDVDLILQKHKIEEVHICGLTTYDCVYASAQESSDL